MAITVQPDLAFAGRDDVGGMMEPEEPLLGLIDMYLQIELC
jgi:hypothetical protein